jgi:hypothetical protein
MYGELYQYLILHKQLNLPGIGTLCVEKKPADFDIADKIVRSPAFTIALHTNQNIPSKNFFGWLGAKLAISEREAVIKFNEFLFELKKQLSAGHKLEWAGIGTLAKGLGGDIQFESCVRDYSPSSSVPAIKVLRENAEHTVRVGEEQKSSVEMKELLHHSDEHKRQQWWWVAALILVILAVLFIGFYFSTNGLSTSSTTNQQKLVPQEAGK